MTRATPALYGLASVIPGLGQTLKGQWIEGIGWFSTTLFLMGQDDYKIQVVGQNIWFYNMYDAWRDAGGKPAKKNWVVHDWAQNFNPVHLTDPVGVGIIGVGAYGRSHAYRRAQDNDDDFTHRVANTETWKSIGMFSFVGLGEEALFRGFLFPSISSWLGVYGGAVVSSTLFGFAHVGNRQANWFRTIFGIIFCWQYHRNSYELGSNIFAHTWYDQILVGPFMMDPQINSGEKTYNFDNWRKRPLGLQVSFRF